MPASRRKRPLRALLAGALACVAAVGVAGTGVLDGPERDLLDARFGVRGARGAPPDVVVVGIDEGTYDRHGFPLPRALHARAIRRLLAAGARTVAYDLQFSEPRERRGDQALLAAAADRRVVLGTAEVFKGGEPDVIGGARRLERSGGRIGMALFPVDDDGVWRRIEGRIFGVAHLSVLAAGGDPDAPERWIDYAGPPGTVRALEFADVVAGRFDARAVRGRIAVVGTLAAVDQDRHPTAAGGGLMAGAEIHANAIQTILDGYPLRDASWLVAALVVLACGLVAPLATLPGRPGRAVYQALGAGLAGGAALLGGAQLAFGGGTVVPVAEPLLALVLGTAGAGVLTYALEVRARRRLRSTFERFVAPDVAAQLLPDEDGAPRLASRRLEATVMFCDLSGFSSLAERLRAEQVIAMLNRYLELVSEAIFEYGGTVVSYQGDGVLAVFGAPLEQADHAARAYAAARRVLDDALRSFNRWLLEQGLADRPLEAGVGLNSGAVMSGLVGSPRRFEYAAVGDATNVAARLQALSRDAPQRLFVAASTHAALGAAGEGLELHGEVRLRGRREPIVIYAR